MPELPEEKFLSAKEVARQLQCDVSTILRQCQAGRIPNIHLGRTYRIPEHWLSEQLERLGITPKRGEAAAPAESPAVSSGPETEVEVKKAESPQRGETKKNDKAAATPKSPAAGKNTEVTVTKPPWKPRRKGESPPVGEKPERKGFWDRSIFDHGDEGKKPKEKAPAGGKKEDRGLLGGWDE